MRLKIFGKCSMGWHLTDICYEEMNPDAGSKIRCELNHFNDDIEKREMKELEKKRQSH